MKSKRNWQALKKEKEGEWPGFVYIGEGSDDDPLSNYFSEIDIYSSEENNNTGRLKYGWTGRCSGEDHYVKEEVWNKVMKTQTQEKPKPMPRMEIHQRIFEIINRIGGTKKNPIIISDKKPVGMFVARKGNFGQLKIGYSFVHSKDKFDKRVGLNNARQMATDCYDAHVPFVRPKYKEAFMKFINRAEKYFLNSKYDI